MINRFASLSTTTKLILIFSAAVLPLVITLILGAADAIEDADQAQVARADEEAAAAARSIDNLLARNVLALRVAGSAALENRGSNPCATALRAMEFTPAVGRRFSLRGANGELLCAVGSSQAQRSELVVAPGAVRLWVEPELGRLYYRVGLRGGMASGSLAREELAAAALHVTSRLKRLAISDGRSQLVIVDDRRLPGDPQGTRLQNFNAGGGHLTASSMVVLSRVTPIDRLMILIPLLLWLFAVLVIWLLLHQLLVRPLRRLQDSVSSYQPGSGPMVVPEKLGAAEIRDLGTAFVRAAERVEESEADMAHALEGQRRLVREVHHRVKNNLQVVASLLSIHGRNAATADSQAAYAAIGRRVDALSVVHRNHFAEVEESRGIALRPLLTELAAGLRGSAPETARHLMIALEADDLRTTQDAAIAAAFLVTEVVEYAMVHAPEQPIEIVLNRLSELTARLSLSSAVLIPDRGNDPEQVQFERVVGGLARQLRSPLERILGRYSVIVPVFPEA